MLVSGCRWKVLLGVLSSWPAGAAARVMLEGAARRVRDVPGSCCKGASEGAAARCCCRVQLLEWRVCSGTGLLVPLQGAASRCCSWSGVSALELACWCHCRMPLQGAAVGFFSEAAGGVARGEWLRRKDLCSQNTSSDLANVPRFRIGKFEVWFGQSLHFEDYGCCEISQAPQTTKPVSVRPNAGVNRLLKPITLLSFMVSCCPVAVAL